MHKKELVIVAVVRRPKDFWPDQWDEFPREAELAYAGPPVQRPQAEGAVFAFNQHSMMEADENWAVLLNPSKPPHPGSTVERMLPVFC